MPNPFDRMGPALGAAGLSPMPGAPRPGMLPTSLPMPAAPAPMPAAAPMPMPVQPAPQPQQAVQMLPGAPQFPESGPVSKAAMIAALLAGIKDPYVMSGAMAGLQRAKDRKQAAYENALQQHERKRLAQAEFYSKVLAEAGKYDDEVELQTFLTALGPMADYHGVPLAGITIGDTKKASKERRLMADAIEAAVKRHGPEIVNRDDVTLQLADGRQVSMRTAREAQPGGVRDMKGAQVPVASAGFTPNTAAEMRLAAYAKSLGKRVEDLTPEEFDAATPKDAASSGASDFDRHLQRHYAAKKIELGRDLTPAELVTEELVAKKAFQQADDKGPDPILNEIRALTLANLQTQRASGAMSPAQFQQAQALSNDYIAETKTFWTQRAAYQQVQSANPSQKSPAGHMALIFAYMKLLDPNSVVRETEYANAQNASAVPDRVRNLYNATVNGAILTERQIADFKAQAGEIYQGAKVGAMQIKGIYDQRAAAQQLDPSAVTYMLDDPLPAGTAKTSPPKPTAAPKAARIGERRLINGQLGEWDGKGWKAVGR